MRNDPKLIAGVVLSEEIRLSLREVCYTCDVSAELIMDMVTEGVIEPQGTEPGEWYFNGAALTRIQTALSLQHDLRVNLPGAALAIDLIEELEEWRRRCRRLGGP